ncbi:MAG: helix-turn-helix domain-containing protein [Deltaproteobacteria bacterium]|jgi:transcriptional regulator with XRE-family HTH domain|nr:helix-turn-helix domain-containing protein [Deltaproteobacteria bacterium]
MFYDKDEEEIHPLKKYLEANHMSYHEFAELLGLTKQSVYYYVSGQRKPRPALAKKIEKVTGIPRNELLYWDEKEDEG